MESARLTATIKTASPEDRRLLIEDWGQDRVAKLERIEPSIRAGEIEGLLQRLTDDDADKALPRFSLELMSTYSRLPTGAREAAYHKTPSGCSVGSRNPTRTDRPEGGRLIRWRDTRSGSPKRSRD